MATDNGRMMALLAHASVFTGFPLFVIPLIQRDDAFALYHAKQAAVVFLAYFLTFIVVFTFSMVTCGFGAIFVFVLFLWWIPAIQGIMFALNGEQKPVLLVGELGETLFPGILPKDGP